MTRKQQLIKEIKILLNRRTVNENWDTDEVIRHLINTEWTYRAGLRARTPDDARDIWDQYSDGNRYTTDVDVYNVDWYEVLDSLRG